ncbi:hypothetical protein PHISCL_10481, partial [Aspergillus sclerotialis]
ITRAIALDQKHGFSNRFTSALTNFDQKYKATDTAKSMDTKYGVSDKAMSAWGGIHTYFEKALGTPTGQKIREFYVQGDKQVRDVHNEARRLADLKAGKQHEPEPVPGTDKTVCKCGGEEGSDVGAIQPEPVKGTDKTVCTCGGSEGKCPVLPATVPVQT